MLSSIFPKSEGSTKSTQDYFQLQSCRCQAVNCHQISLLLANPAPFFSPCSNPPPLPLPISTQPQCLPVYSRASKPPPEPPLFISLQSTARASLLSDAEHSKITDLRQLFLHCAAAHSTSNCRSCSQYSPMSSSLQHHRSIWKLLSPIPISSATALLACSRTCRSLGQQAPVPPLGLELAQRPPPPPEQLASLPFSHLSASHHHADEVEQVVASAIPQDPIPCGYGNIWKSRSFCFLSTHINIHQYRPLVPEPIHTTHIQLKTNAYYIHGIYEL